MNIHCVLTLLSSLQMHCWLYSAAGSAVGHGEAGCIETIRHWITGGQADVFSSESNWAVLGGKEHLALPGGMKKENAVSRDLVSVVKELGLCLQVRAKLQKRQEVGQFPRAGWVVSVVLCKSLGDVQIGRRNGKIDLFYSGPVRRFIFKLFLILSSPLTDNTSHALEQIILSCGSNNPYTYINLDPMGMLIRKQSSHLRTVDNSG